MAKTPRQKKKSSTKAKCSPVPSNLDRYPPEPCDIAFGWTMKSIPRKSKKQSDHYYFNPEGGEMFRSRKEVKRYLNLKAATKSTRTAVLTPQATEKKPAKPERVIARIFSYFKARPLSRLDMFTKTADRICSHHRQVERQQLE